MTVLVFYIIGFNLFCCLGKRVVYEATKDNNCLHLVPVKIFVETTKIMKLMEIVLRWVIIIVCSLKIRNISDFIRLIKGICDMSYNILLVFNKFFVYKIILSWHKN